MLNDDEFNINFKIKIFNSFILFLVTPALHYFDNTQLQLIFKNFSF